MSNEISFFDYSEAAKQIAEQLLGKETANHINNTELKSFDYQGVDIRTSSILATSPGVKERFNEQWTEYFSERDYTPLDMLISTVFHFGYQQAIDTEVEPLKKAAARDEEQIRILRKMLREMEGKKDGK